MKKGLLFILIFLCTLHISAQTVSFKWGEAAPKAGGYYSGQITFVGEKDGHYYFFSEEKRNFNTNAFVVYEFGPNLNLVSQSEVEFPDTDAKPIFNDALSIGNKGYLVFYSYKWKTDQTTIILTEIIKSNGKVSFKHNEIAKEAGKGLVFVTLSEDQTKLAIGRGIDPEINKMDPKKIGIFKLDVRVFDSSLKQIWSKVVEPENYYPSISKGLNNNYYQYFNFEINVSNEGDVCVVFRQRNPEFSFNNNVTVTNSKYRKYIRNAILVLTDNGSTSKTFVPNAKEYSISSLKVIMKDGKLFCAGNVFDPLQTEVDNDYGLVTFVFDLRGNQSQLNLVPLSSFSEIVKLNAMDDDVFSSITITELNGKYLVSYESYELRANSNGGTMYFLKGIFLQMFDDNFDLQWTQFINKYQFSVSDAASNSSFIGIYDENADKTLVVYTAFGKNKDIKDKTEQDEDGSTYQITLDNKGTIIKKAKLFDEKISPLISPHTFTETPSGKFIILAEKRQNITFGLVEIK